MRGKLIDRTSRRWAGGQARRLICEINYLTTYIEIGSIEAFEGFSDRHTLLPTSVRFLFYMEQLYPRVSRKTELEPELVTGTDGGLQHDWFRKEKNDEINSSQVKFSQGRTTEYATSFMQLLA